MVSIIIPIHNSESYIEHVVQSICNQTYKNWELLLCDDGSTDASLAICNDIAKRSGCIRVFSHANVGVAATRNLAINEAKGEYLVFIDSDDDVSKDFLSVLVDEIEKKDCDIVFCGLRRISGEKIVVQLYEDNVYNKDEYYIASYDINKFKTRSSCTAIYKKDIIKNNHILFPENMICGEDAIFVQKYISCCTKNIGTTSRCFYDYINQDEYSATKNLFFDHVYLDQNLYIESYKDSKEKNKFLEYTGQRYIDILIPEIIRYVKYSPESAAEKIMGLGKVVKNKVTQKAIRYYKRQRGNSMMIPCFLRARLSLGVYFGVKYRMWRTHYRKDFLSIKSIYKSFI